jgi:hypothetical protein
MYVQGPDRGGAAARKSKATFRYTFVLVVVIEAFTALLAQPLSVHHAFKQNGRAVLAIPGTLIQRLLDG